MIFVKIVIHFEFHVWYFMVCTREDRVEPDISDKKEDRLKQVETFKYPGLMISANGGCEEEVRHRVGAGWGKWREMSGIAELPS